VRHAHQRFRREKILRPQPHVREVGDVRVAHGEGRLTDSTTAWT
jgi:hypothetical protein